MTNVLFFDLLHSSISVSDDLPSIFSSRFLFLGSVDLSYREAECVLDPVGVVHAQANRRAEQLLAVRRGNRAVGDAVHDVLDHVINRAEGLDSQCVEFIFGEVVELLAEVRRLNLVEEASLAHKTKGVSFKRYHGRIQVFGVNLGGNGTKDACFELGFHRNRELGILQQAFKRLVWRGSGQASRVDDLADDRQPNADCANLPIFEGGLFRGIFRIFRHDFHLLVESAVGIDETGREEGVHQVRENAPRREQENAKEDR